MKAQLIQMLDAAEAFIHRVRIGSSRELTSMFELRDAGSESYLIFTPFVGSTNEEVDRCKDFVACMIREFIIEHKITHYLFLTEAWAITRPLFTPGVSQRPAEADDRVEVILADAHDGTTHLSSSWKIKQKDGTCTDLIPLTIKEERPSQESGGRFYNLLKQDDKRPA